MTRALLLLALLAGCAEAPAGVSRGDCDAVLTHLVVLERDDMPVLCRYLPSCDGIDHDLFLTTCPKVVSRRELGCYQRATSLHEADRCLDRGELVERITTGVVDDDRGYGGGGGTFWGSGGGGPQTPEERALTQLRRLRDHACACKDKACADKVSAELSKLASAWDSSGAKPSRDAERQAEELYTEYSKCIDAVRDSDDYNNYYPPPPLPRPSWYDAAVPTARIGIPECDDYADLIDRLVACDKIPQASKDSLKQGFDAMRSTWGDPTYMDSYTRDAAVQACKAGLSGMRDAADAMGC